MKVLSTGGLKLVHGAGRVAVAIMVIDLPCFSRGSSIIGWVSCVCSC